MKKELDELLMDFNIYNDCILWWSVIISSLKTLDSGSIWFIFEKVAEITPGNVAIQLLEKYELDLTRFDAKRLDQGMNDEYISQFVQIYIARILLNSISVFCF